MKILSAEHVLPISNKPIKNGAVLIEGEKILNVGQQNELIEQFPQVPHENFGQAVIMPGFVNCHAHLEITAMRGFLDQFDDDFSSWLLTLTKTRAERLTSEDVEISAVFGALEGAKAGVTCFGDIGRSGTAGIKALNQNGLRGVLFQETEFSPDNKTGLDDFEKLKDVFGEVQTLQTGLVKAGISPHAPYTVSQKLFELITEFAINNKIKTTIHAAESLEEQNLMQKGGGFFADVYQKRSVNWQSPKCSTIEYLSDIGVLEAKPLLAHCVYVSERDLELIEKSGSAIAHCPKSNAKFGHGIAPLESFLDKSIAVGLGSDSMASNNTCDILEEARFATLLARTKVAKNRFIDAREIIEMATVGGARALGLEEQIGSIETGKQADLIIISTDDVAQMPVHDIYTTLLFATNSGKVLLTMVAGEELFRDGRAFRLDESELKTRMGAIAAKMR
jgi:5-methylthioadenosine/S-adenosylhomocysteine deaminase